MSTCGIDKITRMAIIIEGSKSNKHNIIGVCLSGLQSVVEQVQRLSPPGHFAKTINISEYPEYSGEMIVLEGLSEINSKELEAMDPKMPEDKIASDFEMVKSRTRSSTHSTPRDTRLRRSLSKPSVPPRARKVSQKDTFRPLDLAYQCAQSAKKKYLLGVLYEWVYVEGGKVIVFTMWPQNTFDIEILLYTYSGRHQERQIRRLCP
ncbi:unnamed protein product [Aureobasidium pullulans]|nr:unnamed protein product [Aureobasidium pullulans]